MLFLLLSRSGGPTMTSMNRDLNLGQFCIWYHDDVSMILILKRSRSSRFGSHILGADQPWYLSLSPMQQLMPRWSKFYPCNRSKVKEERKDPKGRRKRGRKDEGVFASLSLSLCIREYRSLLELSSPLSSSL